MSKHRPSYKIDLLLLGAIGGIGIASSDLFLTALFGRVCERPFLGIIIMF